MARFQEKPYMSSGTIPSHRFGSYTLIRKLGEGGMADVYLGLASRKNGDLVPAAIKIAKPVAGIGVDVDELFANEADLMSLLDHPGVVHFLEVGKAEGRFFISMEHMSGGDLASAIVGLRKNGKTCPPGIALAIAFKVLSTLAFVHNARGASGTPLQLVHGDVNPGNIFFDGETGAIKLGDFGVAVSQTMGVGLPDGMAGGKLNYLSPEQAGGLPITGATDVFAMATVLFELMFGVRPFEGGSPDEILARISQCKVSANPPMNEWQKRFFEKAFARREKDRFQTAGAMASSIIRILLDHEMEPSDQTICSFLNDAIDGNYPVRRPLPPPIPDQEPPPAVLEPAVPPPIPALAGPPPIPQI